MKNNSLTLLNNSVDIKKVGDGLRIVNSILYNDADTLFNEGFRLINSKHIQSERENFYNMILNNPGYLRNKKFKYEVINNGDYYNGIDLFNKAIHSKLNYLSFWARGIAKYKLGNFRESIYDINVALEMQPSFPEAYKVRAGAKTCLNDCKGAINDYTEALKVHGSDVEAYREIGAIYQICLRDFSEASKTFSKIIEIDPENDTGYLLRAEAQSYLKNYTASLSDCNRAIDINPSEGASYHSRGIIKEKLNMFKEAIEDYDKAIEIDDYMLAYISRSEAKKHIGDFAGSRVDNEKWIQLLNSVK